MISRMIPLAVDRIGLFIRHNRIGRNALLGAGGNDKKKKKKAWNQTQ
jgi:hypothetical protein